MLCGEGEISVTACIYIYSKKEYKKMVKEIPRQNCKYLIQNRREAKLPDTFSPATALGVRAFHRQLPGYKPTPLVRLERLARFWGYVSGSRLLKCWGAVMPWPGWYVKSWAGL